MRLLSQATRDSLTGLRNHRALQERLHEEIARHQRAGAPLSLLILDVDNFKGFNDSFGHPAGDDVLRSIGGFMEEQARTSDLVARYGGEEFVILLPMTRARRLAGGGRARARRHRRRALAAPRRNRQHRRGDDRALEQKQRREQCAERPIIGARRRSALSLQSQRTQPRHSPRRNTNLTCNRAALSYRLLLAPWLHRSGAPRRSRHFRACEGANSATFWRSFMCEMEQNFCRWTSLHRRFGQSRNYSAHSGGNRPFENELNPKIRFGPILIIMKNSRKIFSLASVACSC